ncbi:DNA primase [Microtetraspora fusca]|uniref:DNA primase n=1 Tax=Microtetraspora fusca TaxID=1997 RepID=UPI00082D7D4A|nr:DNA primase [Microtetraspora fusca]
MLIPIHQQAERFFLSRHGSSWVPGYLAERGFDRSTQSRWHIGYAPADWRALTNHLRRLGFSDTAIESSGLARRTSRGTLIDFFRDRAMFPIKDHDGTTIAFIGRSLDAEPRYLNSPQTPIYRKRQTLFGLHALTPSRPLVITEGPLDAIAVTLAGREPLNGLALCGTALTADHVPVLTRSHDLSHIVLAFDGDRAGRAAATRSYPLFKGICTAEAVTLPTGRDPAGILGEDGAEALAAILTERAVPLADLVVDAAIHPWQRSLDYAEGRIGALRSAGAAIAAMAPHDVARQIARVAQRLGFDHPIVTEAVTECLASHLADADFPAPLTFGGPATRLKGRNPNERSPRGPTP